ncbi:MBL fold metallo-hydrolase [Dyadobacter fanqingshengii]|uniref:MBL fold metallo-hydrolase n=1 Tax=Dyadobacter fanqingshengii TaxID=2906443 RepID=A0A9X1PE81_9BACT|nr:MBL fold metallo-hydrolase [Dyadobacter fanqingshengii]MCF0043376.1 MBL fold metallo-hydrolase [Dyadobacter fanqingshengii]USJ35845.1 MBL fold metallo-hydrolase [Dyadobacter fanqingshengii]
MILFILLALLVIAGYIFMQQPQFGRQPSGARLELIKKSLNYRDEKFQNESFTPDLAEGSSYSKVLIKFFFGKSKYNTPPATIPSQKTDLLHLDPSENVLVWLGHSSYFMQIDGKTFLVDPVFSGSASPVYFTTPSFKGTDRYAVEDFPAIDYLMISHDHWDHLDYQTILKLKSKVKKVVTGLGTGEHFEYWGYNPKIIIEKDWYQEADLGDGFKVNVTPGRHFSGRALSRNKAIWVSFALQTPTMKIFIGGDSGYDKHFKTIGEKFGPFDLALLECGQYNEAWKYIHMMPEETVTAAHELKATKLMPVHWSKFSLALHDWNEPIQRASIEARKQNMPLVTPMIGQKVNLKGENVFTEWWKEVALQAQI